MDPHYFMGCPTYYQRKYVSCYFCTACHLTLILILMYIDIPTNFAGLWTGKFYSSDGTTEPACASLAFLAQGAAYPSAFGATLDAQDRVWIVHGTWQHDVNEVRIKEVCHDVSPSKTKKKKRRKGKGKGNRRKGKRY